MPLLLILLSAATLVVVSAKKSHAAAAPGHVQTFTLDANMPENLRNQVLAALVSGTDAPTLDAFGTAIQGYYPLAAALLHAKAASLRGHALPLPSAPPAAAPTAPPVSADPGGPALDPTMPSALVAFVHSELLSDTDPLKLMAIANQLGQQGYPLAAGLLLSRAAALNIQPSPGPAPTPVSPAPSAPPPAPAAPPAANPSAPAPGLGGLDPGMPPNVAQAVMSALITENDPAKLQALAQQLAAQYPVAASLLTAKANAILAALPPALPAAPVQPAPVPVTPAPSIPVVTSGPLDADMPPALAQQVMSELANEADPTKLQALADQLGAQYPIAAALLRARADVILATRPPPQLVPPYPSPPSDGVLSLYTVQKGDFPWHIAEKLTGHGARWPELVAANPTKKRGKDGNFVSLLPGEKLNVPAAWALASPSAGTSPTPTSPPTPAFPSPPAGTGVVDITPTPTSPAAPVNGLDPNLPATMVTAVTNALQAGMDPTQLRGFATAMEKAGFPLAAGLLNAKADALAAHPAAPVSIPVNYAPAPAAPSPPAGPSAPGGATYKVKAGDNPSKIAAAIVHDGSRWKELVAANPSKSRAKDGNFASLKPGEVLQLPASWAAPVTPASGSPKTALASMPHGGV